MDQQLTMYETNPQKYYHELNEIYANMLHNNQTKLDTYHLYYLIRFKSLMNYVINRIRTKMLESQKIEDNQRYMYDLLSIFLCSRNKDDYNDILSKKSLISDSGLVLGLDFKPINHFIELEDSEAITFIADDQADINVCKSLISGLSDIINKEFQTFFPKPQVFLLRGKGASPYYKPLNCAFLMVGHYCGTEYERKIFSTSVSHELTHLHYGSFQKVSILKEYQNAYKFFDEGIAIQSSYLLLSDYLQYFTKFRNSAYIIHQYSTHSLENIMENWFSLSFNETHFSTYDYACSFVNFIDEQFPQYLCKVFFKEWLSQSDVTSILEYFSIYYQYDIKTIDQKWINELDDFSPRSTYHKKTSIELIKRDEKNYTFRFNSEYDLWIHSDIFCLSQEIIKPIKIIDNDGLRYKKSGLFSIQASEAELFNLLFIVLFKDNVDIIKLYN